MTSLSEDVVIRAEHAGLVTPLSTPELSSGAWTRWGSAGVRGDEVIEDTLSTLADRTRATAHAQGFAVGWAKGAREAVADSVRDRASVEARWTNDEARRTTEHQNAIAALRAAADQLQQLTASVGDRLEGQATELAWAVTAEVLGHQAARDGAQDVVRRVLAVLPAGPVAVVRLHPSVARDIATEELPTGVEITADDDLHPADALVELADHVVDLRIDQALARVRAVLA